MICVFCGANMNTNVLLPEYKTCWGEKEVVVENVTANVCPQCGEINFTGEEVNRMQEEIMRQVTS